MQLPLDSAISLDFPNIDIFHKNFWFICEKFIYLPSISLAGARYGTVGGMLT